MRRVPHTEVQRAGEDLKDSHYDVAIIGAGMSGLAAGIRLAHFGRRVCVFERHNAPGGLNSFYSIDGRRYDVGLHALTNFVAPGVKGTPLIKLLRQLRIDRDELDLCPQKRSRIAFPGCDLVFTNDFAVLEGDVAAKFPHQRDGFRTLVEEIHGFDELSFRPGSISAREVIGRHLTDPLLTDMLFCPLMYYGSATERDMDFGQFVIMFKSIFCEGFARPFEGVRRIIRVLLDRFRRAGGERRMKCGVARIRASGGRAAALVLDSGEEITADHVLSSIGSAETFRLCEAGTKAPEPVSGVLSFVEMIRVLDDQPEQLGAGEDTIIFYNDSDRFEYARPEAAVDPRSGVICLPNNFDYGERRLPEGLIRVTCLANYDRWAGLPEEFYRAEKQRWFEVATAAAARFLPGSAAALGRHTVATDMFTPRTIRKFTGHFNGAVYGAPDKIRDGRTHLDNLYLCGTDQGFLGIVGAMLSGISMANYHILQRAGAGS